MGPTPSAVSGTDLITPTNRFPLGGSVNDLARRAGITLRTLRDVYTCGPDFSLEEPAEVIASAAGVLLGAFTDGDAAAPVAGSWTGADPVAGSMQGRDVVTGDAAGSETIRKT